MPTTSVRRRISLGQPLLGVIRADLAPVLVRERGEGKDVLVGVGEVLGGGREPALQLGDDLGVLAGHVLRVRLVEDRPDQGADQAGGGFGHDGLQVRRVMGAADSHCQLRHSPRGLG